MEFYRVFTVVPVEGKEQELIDAWTKNKDYIEKRYGDKAATYEICASLDGSVSTYLWIEKWKSFTEFEEGMAMWEADPKSKEVAEESRVLHASTVSHFYRILK